MSGTLPYLFDQLGWPAGSLFFSVPQGMRSGMDKLLIEKKAEIVRIAAKHGAFNVIELEELLNRRDDSW